MPQDGTPNTCEPGYPHEGSIRQTHIDWKEYDDSGKGHHGHDHDTGKGSVSLGEAKQERNSRK